MTVARVSACAICALACSTTLDPTIPGSEGEPERECAELRDGSSRYWICLRPLASYEAAQTDCAARGAVLASIGSLQENDLLATTARGLDTHSNLWIGGTRDDDHRWSWQDGTVFWQGRYDGQAPAGTYTNWKTGEPNDSSTVSEEPERCAALTLFDTQWNDRACSIELSFICETPAE